MLNIRMEISDQTIKKWNYNDYFRQYLLLTTRKGRTAIEQINNLPQRIELSRDWHEMLNTIRRATNLDGKERWALVGVQEERTLLKLSTIPVVGNDGFISPEVVEKETRRARDKFGIVDLVGDVHSHPRSFKERVLQKLPANNWVGLKARFSPGDYYHMIYPGDSKVFMGVVEGDYNLFVLRTRETQDLTIDPTIFNQESFEKFWFEKFGYKYIGNIEKNGARRAIPIPKRADPITMNAAIVDRHKLVLYQGVRNKDLIKIYPKP